MSRRSFTAAIYQAVGGISAPLDWLAASNQLLVLTWGADVSLWNVDLLHDDPVTDVQLWDVEADSLTMAAPGAVNGRFSPDGRFLATLLPGNPAPSLQLSNRNNGRIAFTVQTIGHGFSPYPMTNASFSPNGRYLIFFTPGPLALDANGKALDKPLSVSFDPEQPYLHVLHLDTMQINHSLPAPSKAVTWSPNSRQFIYRTLDDNVAVMDVSDGRSIPITLSGGARLSTPQWSFDGHYLSMRVAGSVWGTAVLQTP